MRLFTSAVSSTIAIGLLAGCAGNMGSSNASPLGLGPQARTAPISVFDDAPPRVVSVLHSLVLPDKKRKKPKTGIYVSQFDAADVFGYPIDNMGNKKPFVRLVGFWMSTALESTGKAT